jgi:hypothetical protein
VLLTAAPAAAQQQPVVRAPALLPPVVLQAPPAQQPAQQEQSDDTRDALSEMSAEDMYWMQEFMRRKQEQEDAISDTMREGSETEGTVTPNTRDE